MLSIFSSHLYCLIIVPLYGCLSMSYVSFGLCAHFCVCVSASHLLRCMYGYTCAFNMPRTCSYVHVRFTLSCFLCMFTLLVYVCLSVSFVTSRVCVHVCLTHAAVCVSIHMSISLTMASHLFQCTHACFSPVDVPHTCVCLPQVCAVHTWASLGNLFPSKQRTEYSSHFTDRDKNILNDG